MVGYHYIPAAEWAWRWVYLVELWWRVGIRGDLMIDDVGSPENCSRTVS